MVLLPLALGQTGEIKMLDKRQFTILALTGAVAGVAACSPTVKVAFDKPLEINANLNANIHIKLDAELQKLLQQNPNLF